MMSQTEPGGRASAPHPLDIVQSFLNSVDLEDGPDAFATIDGLAAWIQEQLEAAPFSLTEADCERAVVVREALRDVLMEHSEHAPARDATDRLNMALEGISLTIEFDDSSTPGLVERGHGLDAVFAALMRIVYTASIDGTWQRLKVCRNEACRWAFYDASKNRSGAWCTMAACGSKMKARSYRKRTQTTSRTARQKGDNG